MNRFYRSVIGVVAAASIVGLAGPVAVADEPEPGANDGIVVETPEVPTPDVPAPDAPPAEEPSDDATTPEVDANRTGWEQIGGTYRYFWGSGTMATGWAWIDNAWYRFTNEGR